MPSTIHVQERGGTSIVAREYAVFLPVAWRYWLERCWNNGRAGLPVLFCLHREGTNPETLRYEWPFTQVWDTPETGAVRDAQNQPLQADGVDIHRRRWDHQFIIVHLYGWSSTDVAPIAPGAIAWTGGTTPVDPVTSGLGPTYASLIDDINASLTYGGVVRDQARSTTEELARYADHMPFVRQGHWNPGVFVKTSEPHDEVAFATRVLEEVHAFLLDRLAEPLEPPYPVPTTAIDPDRRYLFGIGHGASVGYRLIAEMPDTWAAFHAMGGAIGGYRYADGRHRTGAVPTVGQPDVPGETLNLPSGGPVSLFVHHGGQVMIRPPTMSEADWREWNDLVVPPGQPNLVAPTLPSVQERDVLDAKRVLPGPSSAAYASAYQPLQVVIDAFLGHNTMLNLPSVDDPSAEDRLGGHNATQRIWGIHPQVVEYRDERMNHTNYDPKGDNAYITVRSIWQWMMAHPR